MRFLRVSPDKKDDGPQARPISQEKLPGHDSDDASALALARVIHQTGLASPAAFLLDTLKPLHWIGGQALWLLQPFIAALSAGRGARMSGLSSGAVARLLEREGGLDELALHLERLRSVSQKGSGSPS